MKTRPKITLAINVMLLLIFVTALGYFAYSKSESFVSKDVESSFQNLIGINDINSSLRVQFISIEWLEGYYDPQIIIRVENLSDETVFLSTDASVTVTAFILADERWIEIFCNSDVHFLDEGEWLTLYPKTISQPSNLLITVWPVLSYPTGYHTEGMRVKNIVRVLVNGELLSDEQKLPVSAYADIPLR
jgi:hypothetical protein